MASQSLAAVVFKQLRGSWNLERMLKSSNASEPSGRCLGTARFTPRPVTGVKDHSAVEEMLYEEHGDFEVNLPVNIGYANPRLTFSRKYVWRLSSDAEPSISVWFTKPGTEELDYLFHQQDLRAVAGSGTKSTVSKGRAHGSHLCVEDMYETDYQYDLTTEIQLEEVILRQWGTSHTVKGPKKDQLITTVFTREEVDS